jgi:hypothetical protein
MPCYATALRQKTIASHNLFCDHPGMTDQQQPHTISEEGLRQTLTVLTKQIGTRLAGTAGEKAAADHLVEQFTAAGADVHVETFPVKSLNVRRQHLEILADGAWRPFRCSLFSNTPGTDDAILEAPLVFFESPAEYRRADLSHLRGKAVVHLGAHIESRQSYRRLIEAAPAFLLLVDVRFPGETPLADGMFPAYTRAIGAVPTINVAFMDAWRWKQGGASSARLRVAGGMTDGLSQNVIAEFKGNADDNGVIVLGAHHDTQADSPGADDNGTGAAGLVELARALSGRKHRRTVRLVSFGAEEQLSVGSAAYVRRHRTELAERGRLMFNLDSFGSLMGNTHVICNGPPELERTILPFFERAGYYAQPTREIIPYGDHFPFVVAGIPAAWLGRSNCASGRFFHHRPDDDMSRLSLPLVAGLLRCVHECITQFACAPELPFACSIPAQQREQAEQMWTDLFDGWTPG